MKISLNIESRRGDRTLRAMALRWTCALTLAAVVCGCSKQSKPQPSALGTKAGPDKTTSAPAPAPAKVSETAAKEPKQAKQKLITLGGSITETVFALGSGDSIIAVDVSSVFPPKVHQLPKVGYHRQLSAEGVISLSPDLVLGSTAVGPPKVVAQLKEAGINLVQVNDEKTIEGTRKRIAAIAKILGKQSEGKALIDSLDQDMKAVKQSTEVKKVLFIYARGAGAVSVAGQKTAADAMIRLAGGVNAVQEYEGYKPINAESIVSAAPDLILLTTRGLKSIGGADGVSKLKGVSLTPAGKNKNILAIDDLMLLGFGPRTGKALRQLAEALK